VYEQQAGHELISGQRGERLVIQMTELVQDGEQPLQPGAVEIRDKADELLSPLPRDNSAGPTGVDQGVDPLTDDLHIVDSSDRRLG
jgi:hypothetical protein